jgi:hypothetical protein
MAITIKDFKNLHNYVTQIMASLRALDIAFFNDVISRKLYELCYHTEYNDYSAELHLDATRDNLSLYFDVQEVETSHGKEYRHSTCQSDWRVTCDNMQRDLQCVVDWLYYGREQGLDLIIDMETVERELHNDMSRLLWFINDVHIQELCECELADN